MARKQKPPVRDPSKLTGKPLSETVIPSHIYGLDSSNSQNAEYTQGWLTSPDLYETDLSVSPDVIYQLSNFLLANPNFNASHLFRADILFDSVGELKTPQEKERLLALNSGTLGDGNDSIHIDETISKTEPAQQQEVEMKFPVVEIEGLDVIKTVVLTLIPRNLNLDKPMDQTCHFYRGTVASSTPGKTVERLLYIRYPHIDSVEDMPFYHPRIRGFAFMYDFERNDEEKESSEESTSSGKGTLSLHILPFPASDGFDPFPTRLERTLQALLGTQIRLARGTKPKPSSASCEQPGQEQVDDTYNPFQDNLIPRHLIQNTYTRLKLTYAQHLCQKWVESTEPSKHVFEDLAITAFLIELWRNMYGVAPPKATAEQQQEKEDEKVVKFPGFVDVACGNGVLVYILLMEGYKGWGFDARRRKTWSIFPDWVQQNLQESLYIPKPFAVASSSKEEQENGISELTSNGIAYHTGEFPRDTFIISNHADELTVWTPLMAAAACPEAPLPFVSIPCCSHSLSGARYRYPPPKKQQNKPSKNDSEEEEQQQPATGDLKALRKAKIAASTAQPDADLDSTAVLNSMYGSLTAKTMSIAAEIGYDVEKTLLRIPSTRNMGVVGGRKSTVQKRMNRQSTTTEANQDIEELIAEIVQRESAKEGGIGVAANIWIQRAIGLQKGKKSSAGGH